jgi:hypothetical protein
MVRLLNQFTEDPTVILLAALVGLDVVLGVLSALVRKTFKFVLIADFLRADVLGKLLPYYAVWAALHITGDDPMIGDFGVIEETTGALAVAALGASVLNSLNELRLRTPVQSEMTATQVLAADDPTTPG